MRTVIQRVKCAEVTVDGESVGKIGKGFLVLLGIHENDSESEADTLAAKVSGLRIFTDANDKMNLSLNDVEGAALVISNFTLYSDCKHGKRPSFFDAARPEKASILYDYFCEKLISNGIADVQKGIFGADMKVSLLNDGPVTLIIDTDELKPIR